MAHARTFPRLYGLHRRDARSHDHDHAPALQRDIDWAAAGWAGFAGGTVFILLETVLISLFTGGPNSDAVRQIAAIALGESALPPSTPFTALVFLAAMAVHLPLSLLYARLLAALVRGQEAAHAAAVGAAFGAVLYVVNFYAFTAILPWFAAARGWMTLLAHVAYGLVAALTYVSLTERKAAIFRR
jgi:hypothetical protein